MPTTFSFLQFLEEEKRKRFRKLEVRGLKSNIYWLVTDAHYFSFLQEVSGFKSNIYSRGTDANYFSFLQFKLEKLREEERLRKRRLFEFEKRKELERKREVSGFKSNIYWLVTDANHFFFLPERSKWIQIEYILTSNRCQPLFLSYSWKIRHIPLLSKLWKEATRKSLRCCLIKAPNHIRQFKIEHLCLLRSKRAILELSHCWSRIFCPDIYSHGWDEWNFEPLIILWTLLLIFPYIARL